MQSARMNSVILVAAGLTLPLLHPAEARAESFCGYMENDSWNVEEGGLIWNQSKGMVLSALQAIGETRTHVAISNGVKEGGSQWITHSTMRTPSINGWPEACDDPLNKTMLQFPQPGASQTPIGGYFNYLHGADGQGLIDYKWQSGNNRTFADTSKNGVTGALKVWQPNANRGKIVSDYLWWSMPYGVFAGASSEPDVDARYFRLKWDNGEYATYGLNQFRDIQQVNLGIGPATNNGMVCSTLASYASQKADAGWVQDKTYTHQQVRDGLQALFDDVYGQCRSGTGFWKRVSTTAACFDSDLCDELSQQVVDCFALGNCTDGESEAWRGVRDDANATARSISPDCVTGWAPGCPAQGRGASPWAFDINEQVVFSGGGRRFGCWD
jgi:hypothetical protein